MTDSTNEAIVTTCLAVLDALTDGELSDKQRGWIRELAETENIVEAGFQTFIAYQGSDNCIPPGVMDVMRGLFFGGANYLHTLANAMPTAAADATVRRLDAEFTAMTAAHRMRTQ